MPTTYYTAKGLIGGAATDLDFFDGDDLNDDDKAFVTVGDLVYEYRLEASSGATENSPAVISPDANAGTKRWILQKRYGQGQNKNLLINGCMRHAQRGASGSALFDDSTNSLNSDDTYLLDRWVLLSDGDNIVDVSQQTLGGVNSQEHYIRLDVETAQKKFGILQIIENKNCKQLLVSGSCSLSFECTVSNATRLSDIRAAVFTFNEGIDTPTSDLVSAWEAEGSVITPIANVTAENVAANLGVTTSWVRYEIKNIQIDTAGGDNVGVFIYQNNVATASATGDFLDITNVQLEEGAVATDFEYRDVGVGLGLCQRYYAKSYDQDVAPASADPNGSIYWKATALASADHNVQMVARYPVFMRDTATVIVYDLAGTAGKIAMASGDGIAATIDQQGHGGFRVIGTNGAANTARTIKFQYTANSEL